MIELTAQMVQRACPFTPAARVVELLPFLNSALPEAQANTPLRVASFLSQVAHETMHLHTFEENLNYSAAGLREMWPKHFQTDAVAAAYAHQPERIANRAYALRLGNGDEESGEGWKYRGRGGLQQTGEESYLRFTRETGIDVLAHPELLAQPRYAFVGAAKVWIWKGLNVLADRGDTKGITHRIAGALTGLADREKYFDRFCVELGALSLNLAVS